MLTDTQIRSLKPREKTYRIADHNGLCIEVRPSGSKLWRYRYRFDGKASMLSLGEYPNVSLSEARKARDEAKQLIFNGQNPAQVRKTEKIEASFRNKNSFQHVAEEYVEEILRDRSANYVSKFVRSLEVDIYPVIGTKKVDEVSSADVLHIAKSTVTRVRGGRKVSARGSGEVTALNNIKIIGAIMRYAIATLRAENDPTYAVRGAIPRPDIEHARPLENHEQVAFRVGVEKFRGTTTVKHALLTLAYTMLRSVEVRRMKWDYVDFESRIIIFPISTRSNSQERTTKKNRIHLVPMSNQLYDLLKKQYLVSGSKEYVFPGVYNTNSASLGPTTINVALRNLGLNNVTAHDFRATASTILNELNFEEDWIEKQLAHAAQNKVRASYNHAKYLNQRRDMLQKWADIVDSWGKDEEYI